jgi:ATP/ADP translocase
MNDLEELQKNLDNAMQIAVQEEHHQQMMHLLTIIGVAGIFAILIWWIAREHFKNQKEFIKQTDRNRKIEPKVDLD